MGETERSIVSDLRKTITTLDEYFTAILDISNFDSRSVDVKKNDISLVLKATAELLKSWGADVVTCNDPRYLRGVLAGLFRAPDVVVSEP